MLPTIAVLYEDQRGPEKSFGFHDFVIASVFDRIDGNYYEIVKALEGRPLKGATKLLPDIKLVARRRHIVAVLDDDKIRSFLDLPPDAPEGSVISSLQSRYGSDATYILLKRNLESVLLAAKECGYNGDFLDKAMTKNLMARDIVFEQLARQEAQPIRRCIQEKMESLRQLVSEISGRLRPEESAQQPGGDV